ncbi:MAG: DMT family transporter [Promethearchaeota archaeon]
MELTNEKKGIIFGILATFLIGFQPIVANSRPLIIDSYLFAATTCLVEAIVFFPLFLRERKKLKTVLNAEEGENNELVEARLNGWKRNKKSLVYVGLTFGFGHILFFLGYQFAGAIPGAIAQKSTIIFSLIFGALILKERLTKIQIIFCFILLFGLILAVTQSSFNLLEINLGVILLLVLACMWMLAHTYTKPLFLKNESTPTQIVFLRNIIGGIALISSYFIFFPLENINLFLDPLNLFYMWTMGIVYCSGLWAWYKTLSYLDISKASMLVSPTPITTALYATLLLNDEFTIYHLIGTIVIIFSIIVIMSQKKEKEQEQK